MLSGEIALEMIIIIIIHDIYNVSVINGLCTYTVADIGMTWHRHVT